MGRKKDLRRITLLVTPQTDYHLGEIASMCGTSKGHVVDKLVREKCVSLRAWGGRGERRSRDDA